MKNNFSKLDLHIIRKIYKSYQDLCAETVLVSLYTVWAPLPEQSICLWHQDNSPDTSEARFGVSPYIPEMKNFIIYSIKIFMNHKLIKDPAVRKTWIPI